MYCSIPPSVEKEERKLLDETVARECCPETVQRIKETGAQVVSRRRVVQVVNWSYSTLIQLCICSLCLGGSVAYLFSF